MCVCVCVCVWGGLDELDDEFSWFNKSASPTPTPPPLKSSRVQLSRTSLITAKLKVSAQGSANTTVPGALSGGRNVILWSPCAQVFLTETFPPPSLSLSLLFPSVYFPPHPSPPPPYL